jgi:dTDP-D-glucose 4,6-dehydratase
MKNIIVTGGSGFIGSHLINKLTQNSFYNIINIDCLNTHASLKNVKESSNYAFFYSNINNIKVISNILHNYNIDTVIHLAADTDVEDSYKDSISYTNNNTIGTQVILEAIKNNKSGIIVKFIYISVADNQYFTPYLASKKAGEIIVESYYKSFGIPYVIVKGNNIFGPNQYIKNIIPNCINSLLQNEKCKISNYGKSIYSFTYIDDFINALELIIYKGESNKSYLVDSNIVLSRIEMIDIIRLLVCPNKNLIDILSFETDEWQIISQSDGNDDNNTNTLLCSKTLDWRTSVSFSEGLLKTIDWYNSIDLSTYWSK